MSATRILVPLLLALAVLAPKLAVAQGIYDYSRITYRNHARESYNYGRAAATWARGQHNLATAQARIYDQEAYSKYLKNRQTAARTYFAMRKENREARLEEKKGYLGALHERHGRWMAYKAYREEQLPELREFMQEYLEYLAKLGAPKPLSPSELDPATGAITWPLVLKEPEFSRYRQQIESFFRQRSQPSFEPSLGAYQHVLNAIRAMRAMLKGRVSYTEPGLYVGGPKFLESLAYEVRRK